MLERIGWSLSTLPASHGLRLIAPTLVFGALFYFGDYFVVFVELLYRVATRHRSAPPAKKLPSALLVIPSLVRSGRDADGMWSAATSAARNGYPGPLSIVLSIDDAGANPSARLRLEALARAYEPPPNVSVHVVGTPRRVGKAMAIEHAIDSFRARCREAGCAMPTLFFNMDADSELGPLALAYMGTKLVTPRGLFGTRPAIVASNVIVPVSHYASSWRRFLSLEGQIAASVAREYLSAITLAKHNRRLLPVTTASGALYCTWTRIHLEAPRHARWLKSLRFRDFVAFWFGRPLPRFEAARFEPLAEAMTGPGDDTYISWVSLSARFVEGRPTLAPPANPFEALRSAFVRFFERPLDYDARAKIFTTSPTRVKALFVQRKRWNGSRGFTIGRLLPVFFYAWDLGVAVFAELVIVVALNLSVVAVLAGLVLRPFDFRWVSAFVFATIIAMIIRFVGTLLALWAAEEPRAWPTLFAVITSYPYHLVFNVVTTFIVWFEDLFLFGTKTNFAPEATLIRSGSGRIAVAYRVKRGLHHAMRALVHGDVPFGAHWFGWSETPYAHNGYAGWTDGPKPVLRIAQRRNRAPTEAQRERDGG